jgi:hypothetical protein
MKLKLINGYEKARIIKNDLGLPVVDELTNKPVTQVVTMWRYGVVDATPKEIAMYKQFKRQDGKDYYNVLKDQDNNPRLVNGKEVPLYHTSTHMGKEKTLSYYVKEDGRIGFAADNTELLELKEMANKYPALAASLQMQMMSMETQGSRLILSAIEDEIGSSEVEFEEETEQDAADPLDGE